MKVSFWVFTVKSRTNKIERIDTFNPKLYVLTGGFRTVVGQVEQAGLSGSVEEVQDSLKDRGGRLVEKLERIVGEMKSALPVVPGQFKTSLEDCLLTSQVAGMRFFVVRL